MSIQQFIAGIEYPLCRQQGHNEECSLVCLSQLCSKSVLICPLCEFQLHSGHQTKPLMQFLEQGQDRVVDNALIMKEAWKIQESIESGRLDVLRELKNLKQKFQIAYLKAINRVEMFYNFSSSRIVSAFQSRTRHYLEALLIEYNQSHNFTHLQKVVQGLKAQAYMSLSQQAQLYSKAIRNKTDNFMAGLNRHKIVGEIESIVEIFQMLQKDVTNGLYAWKSYPSNIVAKMNRVVQTQSSTKAQRFALAEPIYNISNDILIKFKISKLKGWIGIGICLKKVIEGSNYFFNDTKHNHGSYLISANGYCWSHSEPLFNSIAKSFSFKEGDVITVYYNSLQGKVFFNSSLLGSKFQLRVEPCGDSDKYVPCVNLCQNGDEVEIVNDLY